MPWISFILTLFLWIGPKDYSMVNVNQIDPVITAIELGSSSDLSKHFLPSISLNINGQQGDFSKNQAELVLREFFKKNPPSGFSLIFKNENPSSHSTYVGEYSSNNAVFKVFIKVSQIESNIRIYSLDFVKG